MRELKVNIPKKAFNEIYMPFLNDENRYLIFYGGAGSGKSYFVAQRYIIKIMSQSKCNLMVARKTLVSHRGSTFALFNQIINEWGLHNVFRVNKSGLSITCIHNNNQIVFKGLDDVERLKSTTFINGDLSDVWIEEASEVTEDDYNQLDIRLRGKGRKKQLLLTFNPIDINHWIKKKLIDTGKAKVLKTTYKDNKFIEEEYKEVLEGFKETDPYYYEVYCLGNWGVYGESVFDKNIINRQINKDASPVKTGQFEFEYDGVKIKKEKFSEDKNGYIKIYKEPNPRHYYVIGGDTAGEGSDSFVGQVIDNITGEQAAVLKHTFDEDLYARQMYCLGKYYNNALIAIESNFSTYPIKELQRLKYNHMYVRMREDTYTGKKIKSFGFKTTKLSRQNIIANLVKIVREEGDNIIDKQTLEEMLTFVRNEKGRAEAMQGSHDDLVMALAIGYYCSDQQRRSEKAEKKKERVFNFEVEKPKQNGDMGSVIEII